MSWIEIGGAVVFVVLVGLLFVAFRRANHRYWSDVNAKAEQRLDQELSARAHAANVNNISIGGDRVRHDPTRDDDPGFDDFDVLDFDDDATARVVRAAWRDAFECRDHDRMQDVVELARRLRGEHGTHGDPHRDDRRPGDRTADLPVLAVRTTPVDDAMLDRLNRAVVEQDG